MMLKFVCTDPTIVGDIYLTVWKITFCNLCSNPIQINFSEIISIFLCYRLLPPPFRPLYQNVCLNEDRFFKYSIDCMMAVFST